MLITGGSKGIGRATARAFAREGAARIHIAARSALALDALAQEIGAAHRCEGRTHALDLTDAAARNALIEQTLDVE